MKSSHTMNFKETFFEPSKRDSNRHRYSHSCTLKHQHWNEFIKREQPTTHYIHTHTYRYTHGEYRSSRKRKCLMRWWWCDLSICVFFSTPLLWISLTSGKTYHKISFQYLNIWKIALFFCKVLLLNFSEWMQSTHKKS